MFLNTCQKDTQNCPIYSRSQDNQVFVFLHTEVVRFLALNVIQ